MLHPLASLGRARSLLFKLRGKRHHHPAQPGWWKNATTLSTAS
jgi:hypothetical protein